MKANELRIGNYIFISILQDDGSFKNELFAVNSTVIRDAEHYGSEWNANPIPLTEEWLLKFGFEANDNYYFSSNPYQNRCWVKFSFGINNWDDGRLFYDWNGGNIEVRYVHSLQNLYFALTGEELSIVIPAKEIKQ